MNYTAVKNNATIRISEIPDLEYGKFLDTNALSLMEKEHNHCVNYFGFPYKGKIKLICCMADDQNHLIYLTSSTIGEPFKLGSFTAHNPAFEKFEREIHENFGIEYTDHPWLKPVRYSAERSDKSSVVSKYPFFGSGSEEFHEVGVGPIHAGIIEPGHFRFICNGEQVIHLEIQLGYQHRGVERLFLEKKKLLQREILAESIAGDTVAGHTVAFVNLWESLCGYKPDSNLKLDRTLALELERIAMHTGDLSAICADIAYQLGSSVFGRLRTPIINYLQIWCGNRLSKGLIRAGKSNYPFTGELADKLIETFDKYDPDFEEMSAELFRLSSVLARLEKTGELNHKNAKAIGVVGMAARMCNIKRDIRCSHPHDLYDTFKHEPILKHHGDVYSRAQIRKEEIRQSVSYIRKILGDMPVSKTHNRVLRSPAANSFSISLTEGWRGEICHASVTNGKGELAAYKIKDPSFHNWLALALAVRNNEISDFPVCNKSFNLSYCGHDL